jgi:HPr kinase/phosphorylase
MTTAAPSVHASAVLAGDSGILIRGPSGAGKSRLALDLIGAGRAGLIPPTTLVGDDRVRLHVENGSIVIRPIAEIQGLIEVRGLGIRSCDFVPQAALRLVVDLAAGDAARMPQPDALFVTLHGIKIPRIPVGAGFDALPLVIATLTTSPLKGEVPAAFRRLPEGDW